MITRSSSFSDLANLGMSVFPVLPGDKKPAVRWTVYQSEHASEADIADWDRSNYNVGVACGRLSNLLVIDIDSEDGQQLYNSLEAPLTPTVRTAKGYHYYFRMPAGDFRNTVRVDGVGLDVRAEGGYVVGPGSVHPSGALYQWVVSPIEADFADVPSNLIALLSTIPSPSAKAPTGGSVLPYAGAGRFDAYLSDALTRGLKELNGTSEGARNDTLFRVAVRIANDVAAAGTDWEAFAPVLERAATAIGLPARECQATIDSAWQNGRNYPTAWIKTAQEWAYVAARDQLWNFQSRQSLAPKAFNTMFNSQMIGERGNIVTFLTKFDLIDKIHDFRFDPSQPGGIYVKDGLRWLNTYLPPLIEPLDGDASPFVEFVSYLLPNVDERDHLLRMIAWTVRNPSRKLGHALMLRSEQQGVGKSTLIEIWRRLLGEKNTRKTTTEEISGPYQNYIDGALLVVVEELNLGFGMQGYNRIKDLITGTTAEVNEKFIASREKPNFATFVFLTNLANPMLIEDTDRRLFFVESPAAPRESTYYQELNGWWRSNLGVIRNFLDGIDLSNFNPHAPPLDTEAKRRLRTASRPQIEQELGELISERRWPFSRDIVTVQEVRASLGHSGHGKSNAQIQTALRSLGAHSLDQHRVSGRWTTDGGREVFIPESMSKASLWAVGNVGYWKRAAPSDRAQEYARRDGMFSAFYGWDVEIRHAITDEAIFSELCLSA